MKIFFKLKGIKVTILSMLLLLLALSNAQYENIAGISLKDYLLLMNTETDEEFIFPSGTVDQIQLAWAEHTKHEWERATALEQNVNASYPFLVCADVLTNAVELKESITSYYDDEEDKISIKVVKLSREEVCFVIHTKSSMAQEMSVNLNLRIQPVSYAMKMIGGSVELIEELLTKNSSLESDKFDSNGARVGGNSYIDVMLCPGVVVNNNTLTDDELRTKVLDYVRETLEMEKDFFWTNADRKSQRAQFWQDVLQTEETNENGTDICHDAYDYLVFSFDEMLSFQSGLTPEPISILTIEFQELELVIHDFLSSSSSETETQTVIQHTKKCILKLLLSLALLPETCVIHTRPQIELMNQNAQWLVQTGVEGVTPFYDVGLNGTGEVVSVSDTGVDLQHCFFANANDDIISDEVIGSPAEVAVAVASAAQTLSLTQQFEFGRPFTIDLNQRKVVQYDDYVNRLDMNYGHGTHVSGSICGNPPSGQGISRGIAFGAKLAFIDIGDQLGYLATPKTSRLLGTGAPYAKIHSASWGSVFPGYGINAWLMDSYMYENDDFLLFVAAGNDGSDNKAYTVGEPATGKNMVSVGSSHSYGNDLTRSMLGPSYISSFSSRGPTLDGRTKPDILAPGSYVVSAAAINGMYVCEPEDKVPPGPGDVKDGLISFQGTSMSTPIVAGVAALIRQYLREGFYPTGERNETNSYTNPSSALIKAIIFNGGQYMNGVDNGKDGVTPVTPYDNAQNFGRVSLVDSLYLRGKSNVQTVFVDRVLIGIGETKVYTVKIDTSGGCNNLLFSATLVWNDMPSLPGCRSCLINDLDLHVRKNNDESITYYPNGLQNPDSINNNERVRLSNIADGDTFTIYVSAENLLTSTQAFSLVATGCFSGSGNDINMAEGNVFLNDDSAQRRKSIIFMSIFIPLAVIAVAGVSGWFYKRKNEEQGYY